MAPEHKATEKHLSLSYEELKKFQENRKQLEIICHQLLQIIQACSHHDVLPHTLVDEVEKVSHKLQSQRFRIAIVGEFSRGKSTLVNALVGEKIQPVRAIACNSTITVLKYGSQKRIVCHYKNGREEEISFEQYQDKVTLSKQAVRKRLTEELALSEELARCEIEEIIFEHPSLALCQNGLEIVDSPGLNEHPARAAVTHQLLKDTDAVIFLTSASQALNYGERQIILDLVTQLSGGKENEPANNLFIVVNKWDELKTEEDRQDVKELVEEFSYGETAIVTGNDRVHFISADAALNAIVNGDDNEYLKSFQSFTQSLEKFLTVERGFLENERITTKLQGLIQSSLEGLVQAEEILDGKLEISEAARQKILEQIGEASGRDVRIRNLANQLKEKAIQQAKDGWVYWYKGSYEGSYSDYWYKSLGERMADKSKNWKSIHNPFSSQNTLIIDYINQFNQDLSKEIKDWGSNKLDNGILKPKLKQLNEEIEQEFKAIKAEFRKFDLQFNSHLSEQLETLVINHINDDFVGAGAFAGGIGIGGALAAALIFLAPIGIVAAIIASVVAAITGTFGLGMLDVDGLRDKIKLKVCAKGLMEFDPSFESFKKEKLKEIVSSVFDKRVESASRAIAQAISIYENLLQQQEKAHQETLEQREAEKVWIAQKRQELEQVQNNIEAILNQFTE
jgi:GTPase Era involved in 16S rRNA processing